VFTRVILTVIGGIALAVWPQGEGLAVWRQGLYHGSNLVSMWAVWDSKWYLDIARHGYAAGQSFNPGATSNIGFFPLYPVLVFLASFYVGGYLVSGLVVSNLALIAGAYLLYKLVRLDMDEAAARRSIKYLLILPAAYIFSAVYSESLALLLSVAAIYFARTDRWWWAGASGLLLSAARPTGVLIILPLFVLALQDYLKSRKFAAKYLSLALVPMGLVAFCTYCFLLTGDFLAYSHVQQAAWHHGFSNPILVIFTSVTAGASSAVINALFLLAGLAAVLAAIRRLPLAYSLYAIAVMLAAPATGMVAGSIRYVSAIFVLPIILAMATKRDLYWRYSCLPG